MHFNSPHDPAPLAVHDQGAAGVSLIPVPEVRQMVAVAKEYAAGKVHFSYMVREPRGRSQGQEPRGTAILIYKPGR